MHFSHNRYSRLMSVEFSSGLKDQEDRKVPPLLHSLIGMSNEREEETERKKYFEPHSIFQID